MASARPASPWTSPARWRARHRPRVAPRRAGAGGGRCRHRVVDRRRPRPAQRRRPPAARRGGSRRRRCSSSTTASTCSTSWPSSSPACCTAASACGCWRRAASRWRWRASTSCRWRRCRRPGPTSPAVELFRQRAARSRAGRARRHVRPPPRGRARRARRRAAPRPRDGRRPAADDDAGRAGRVDRRRARRAVDAPGATSTRATAPSATCWPGPSACSTTSSAAALLGFAVFAGPVRARELPAAVSGARPADTVARLVDRSLVLAAPAPDGVRFGALETIRSYGLERLRATGGYDDARRRHADVVRRRGRRDRRPAAHRRRAGRDAPLRGGRRRGAGRAALGARPRHRPRRRHRRARLHRRAHPAAGRGRGAGWRTSPADCPPTTRCRRAIRSALVGGLAFVGRLEEAKAIGEELLAADLPGGELMYALEGLGDIATYEGRLDESMRDVRTASAVPRPRAATRLYADLATIGLALGAGYAGRTDEALATLAAGPTCPAPSARAWFEYVTGEVILDDDPAVAIGHLDRAEELGRIAGNRFLIEVSSLSATTLRARQRSARRGRRPLRRPARPLRRRWRPVAPRDDGAQPGDAARAARAPPRRQHAARRGRPMRRHRRRTGPRRSASTSPSRSAAAPSAARSSTG